MSYRKKLIEVALPLEAINAASAREKSIRHGHPSTLHLWWARRPLAACRAVIFASLVDDPDDPAAPPAYVEACRRLPRGKNAAEHDTPRQRLFDFIERLVLWESTTDEPVLETARELIHLATDGNPPPLLDPFAGGGSIPLEAQRLGLEAHASDLNPVAVMINKALIEIPPKFANRPPVNPGTRASGPHASETLALPGVEWKGAAGLAADVRYYGEWMRDRAWERIGHLYPPYGARASRPQGADGTSAIQEETVIAWLWARTVKCPNPACGAQMPLITSFELSKKPGRATWIEPVIDKTAKTVRFTVKTGKGKAPEPPKVSRGAKFRCLVCGEMAPDQHLKDEGMAGRMSAQLMAIVTEGQNGRNYHAPTPEHEAIAAQAKPEWRPVGQLADDPRNVWCRIYGFNDFADLFTPRQLTALTTFSDLVSEAREQIHADAIAAGLPNDDIPLREGGIGAYAYAEAASVYLAFAVDRVADYCSTLAIWSTSRDQLIHTFTRQALPMTWDFPEVNVFAGTAGDFYEATNSISKIIPDFVEAGIVLQDDAATLHSNERLVVCTDPPYYDNIGYADLSDFFYIWLRGNLKNIYPDILSTMLVPKQPELIASPYRFNGDKGAANEHFESGLMQAFSNIGRVIKPDYPLTVFYAFKQSELVIEEGVASTGWETMLNGLVTTGFQVVGTWPMRTERNTGVKASVNALASSIVLVCRPRPADAPTTTRREFVNALRRELPAALREMQSGAIAPVDLAQASIGPGMAVYSRYAQVLEADGQPLTVRTALQLINQALDAYLAEQEGDLDPATRFAVAWFEQYGFNAGEFGVADVLARAKNTSVDALARAGFLDSGAGKVRLLAWDELDPGRLGTRASGPQGADGTSAFHVGPQGADETSAFQATVWEAVHYLVERLNTHGEQGAALLMARMPSELAAEARQLAYRLYSLCERKGWADHARDYNALVVSWGASQEQAQGLREQYQQGSFFN